jgi:hypothetical protein
LNLKAKLESGSSEFSVKRFVPDAFNAAVDRVNLHRLTT